MAIMSGHARINKHSARQNVNINEYTLGAIYQSEGRNLDVDAYVTNEMNRDRPKTR